MHTHLSIYFFFSTLSTSRAPSNFDIFSAVGSKDGISIVHTLYPSTVLHTIFCYPICPIDRSIKRKICFTTENFLLQEMSKFPWFMILFSFPFSTQIFPSWLPVHSIYSIHSIHHSTLYRITTKENSILILFPDCLDLSLNSCNSYHKKIITSTHSISINHFKHDLVPSLLNQQNDIFQ